MEGNVSIDHDTKLGERISPRKTIDAMQELLDRVSAALERGESMPSRPGDEPVAVHHIAAELFGLIEKIRAKYRSMADREIARAFRAVTASATATPPGVGGAIRLPRELEMLILGQGPQPTEPPHVAPNSLDAPPLDDTAQMAEEIAPATNGGAIAMFANRPLGQESREPTADVARNGQVHDAEHDRVGQAEQRVEEPPAEPATARVEEITPGERAPTVELPEGMLDGVVRLTVFSQGNMQRVVKFVDALSQRPQFRVLRMTGNPQQEAAEIDVGLREPVPLLEILSSMGHLARPEDRSNDGTPRLSVKLGTAAGN